MGPAELLVLALLLLERIKEDLGMWLQRVGLCTSQDRRQELLRPQTAPHPSSTRLHSILTHHLH